MMNNRRRPSTLLGCLLLLAAGALATSLRSKSISLVGAVNSPEPTSVNTSGPRLQRPIETEAIGPIDRNVIGGGGGTASGGTFVLSGTVAEVSASDSQSG